VALRVWQQLRAVNRWIWPTRGSETRQAALATRQRKGVLILPMPPLRSIWQLCLLRNGLYLHAHSLEVGEAAHLDFESDTACFPRGLSEPTARASLVCFP
jgi:hypothetical protein